MTVSLTSTLPVPYKEKLEDAIPPGHPAFVLAFPSLFTVTDPQEEDITDPPQVYVTVHCADWMLSPGQGDPVVSLLLQVCAYFGPKELAQGNHLSSSHSIYVWTTTTLQMLAGRAAGVNQLVFHCEGRREKAALASVCPLSSIRRRHVALNATATEGEIWMNGLPTSPSQAHRTYQALMVTTSANGTGSGPLEEEAQSLSPTPVLSVEDIFVFLDGKSFRWPSEVYFSAS